MGRLFASVEVQPFGPSSKPGVYAVCVKNGYGKKYTERIIYIGSAKNIKSRVLSTAHVYRLCHDRYSDKVVYLKEIETEDYISLEKSLIKIYRPLLNKQYKNNG